MHLKENLVVLYPIINTDSYKSVKDLIYSSNIMKVIKGKRQEERLTLKTVIKLSCYFNIPLNKFINKQLTDNDVKKNITTSKIVYPKTFLKSNLQFFIETNHLVYYQIEKSTTVSRTVIEKIIHGKIDENNLTIKTVTKLANFLNVSLDDFVFKDLSKIKGGKLSQLKYSLN